MTSNDARQLPLRPRCHEGPRFAAKIMLVALVTLLIDYDASARARTWTSTDGKFTVEAQWIATENGKVRLKSSDGRVIEVPLEKLSEADRAFAAEQAKLATAAGPAGPVAKEPPPEAPAAAPPVKKLERPTKPAAAAIAVAARPAKPEAKSGAWILEGGIPAKLYAKICDDHSAQLLPGISEKIQSGEIKVIGGDGRIGEPMKPVKWNIYVPKEYNGEVPYGVWVFINSSDNGGIPAWRGVFDKYHLIYIGADGSGNSAFVPLRIAMAVQGVEELRARYRLDSQRIYVSGSSGGGRVASHIMIMYPDFFAGGMPMVGTDLYRDLPAGGTKFYKASYKILDMAAFARAKTYNRFLFFTGDNDSNREETKGVYDSFVADGFKHATYMQMPGGGHAPPDAAGFEKAVKILDEPVAGMCDQVMKDAAGFEKKGQLGAAEQRYLSLLAHADADMLADAKTRVTALDEQYEQEVAKLEATFAEGKLAEAKKITERFRARWGEMALRDASRFEDALPKPKVRGR